MALVRGVLLIITSAAVCFADGSTPAQPEPAKASALQPASALQTMGQLTVTGRLRVTGSATFRRTVISDNQNRDWHISRAERKKLAGYEQKQVTVQGNGFFEPIILANGEQAGLRYHLRDISVQK